jgi:hypothetical protein
MASMDSAIAHLPELRIRFRRNPEARALVDRCLWLISEEADADEARLAELHLEVERLRAELAARFGEKAQVTHH